MVLKPKGSNIEHILISSFVIGYIYCNIAKLIPISLSYELDSVMLVISALLLGYLLAMAVRSKKIFFKMLDILHIHETGNAYYWDDIIDDVYPTRIRVTFDNYIYEGMIQYYESRSNSPHIVLSSYKIMKSNNVTISDFSENNSKIIILDTSRASHVEISYMNESHMRDDLKCLCSCNKDEYFKKQ